MRYPRITFAVIVLLLLFCFTSSLLAQQADDSSETAALEVDGRSVSYQQLFEQFSLMFPEQASEALDTLILQVTIEDRVKKMGVEITDAQVTKRLDAYMQRLLQAMQDHPDLKDVTLQQYLAMQGQTEEQLKSSLQTKIREQLQAEFLLGPEILRSDRMQLATIKCTERDQIETVKRKLQEGGAFSILAEQYSQDTSTNQQGGSLGTVSKDLLTSVDYQAPYMDFVLMATENGISEIIPLVGGFGIYQISEFRAGETFSPEEEAKRVLAMVNQMEISDKEMNLFLTKIRKSVTVKRNFDQDD